LSGWPDILSPASAANAAPWAVGRARSGDSQFSLVLGIAAESIDSRPSYFSFDGLYSRSITFDDPHSDYADSGRRGRF